MKNTKSCCYGCVAPKRHIGCHCDCSAYLKELAEHEQIKNKRRLAKEIDNFKFERISATMENMRKRAS